MKKAKQKDSKATCQTGIKNEKLKQQIQDKKERVLSFDKLKDLVTDQNSSEKAQAAEKQEISNINKKLETSLKEKLYLRAEFENFRRKSLEEKNQLIRYGGEQFIVSLANEVLDDLDRAMASSQTEASFENLQKGLMMIQKKLEQVLTKFGVQTLDPLTKAFDPSYQEALSYIKTSKVPDGHVVETFRKAYKLHDKVIRPAQVVLAQAEEESQEE